MVCYRELGDNLKLFFPEKKNAIKLKHNNHTLLSSTENYDDNGVKTDDNVDDFKMKRF